MNFDETLDEFIIKVWHGVTTASGRCAQWFKIFSEEEFIFLCTKICFHKIFLNIRKAKLIQSIESIIIVICEQQIRINR